MIMYKILNNPMGISCSVIRLFDNAVIPFDKDNVDYQAYLAWVAQGNTPLPADE